MSEVAQRYFRIAHDFSARIAGMRPDQWSAPTPCTEWTVRDIVAHVISNHRRALAGGSEPAAVTAEDDLATLWSTVSRDLLATLKDPERASTLVEGPFGEQPLESVVGGLLCADTLVHTWDLARATGQDERLDPGAVAKAAELATSVGERMRRPGGFAAKIESAPDADDQTRLLNVCGREV
jgi:uncharacterized protein (TIGR03086 family)